MRKEACWRRMLVVQPAITRLEVVSMVHGMGGDAQRSGCLQLQDGLRMGLLYDLVQETIGEPISRFMMQWGMFQETKYEGGDVGHESVEQQDPKRERGSNITLVLHHVSQCCVDMPNELGPEFESEGFEKVEIEFGKWTYKEH